VTELEAANAALRDAVETRLAGRSAMAASLSGCQPALEAATAALASASDFIATSEESSEVYSEWTPPEYARREEAIAGFRRVVEQARPAREAREVHPTSQAFYELCDSLKEMHTKKSYDYGSAHDPLANIRNGAEFVGIEPWRAAMVRLSDKVTRLQTYCRTGRLEHEGVEDTLHDLASYALLTLLMHRERRDS
jgi:hypothetical protein